LKLAQEEIRYVRNPDFIYRKIVDESVLVPVHKDVADMDSIFTLNEVGAFIWEQLEEATTRSALERAVLLAYDADPQVLQADLDHFLDEMVTIQALKEIEIITQRMEVSSEILAEVKRKNLRFVEVPINTIYSMYSLEKGQKNSNSLSVLIKLILRRMR